jgi:hypothetical protein
VPIAAFVEKRRRGVRLPAQRGVDLLQLLEARELRELRRHLIALHRIHRILVLHLRDEQLHELILAHRAARSISAGRAAGRATGAGGTAGACRRRAVHRLRVDCADH